MSLFTLTPQGVRPTAVARANPVAKLAAASAVALALLLTVDVVTAGAALLLELVLLLPTSGLPWALLWRRTVVLVLAAVPSGVATALLGVDGGALLAQLGPATVTTGSATAGLAIALRILAVGLPGVLLLASTDPTDLGDALSQVLHLPSRFVLAALAALRLVEVLAQEWGHLGAARRARGLGDDGPVGRLRTWAGQAFALFVLALRRGAVLSLAMEARGFGAATTRTWARPSRLVAADAVVVAGGVLAAATATAAGVAAGTWRLPLS